VSEASGALNFPPRGASALRGGVLPA